MENFETCKRCNKEVKMYKVGGAYISDLFSGGLCLECYEKHFETLTEKEKKPNFKNIIN